MLEDIKNNWGKLSEQGEDTYIDNKSKLLFFSGFVGLRAIK